VPNTPRILSPDTQTPLAVEALLDEISDVLFEVQPLEEEREWAGAVVAVHHGFGAIGGATVGPRAPLPRSRTTCVACAVATAADEHAMASDWSRARFLRVVAGPFPGALTLRREAAAVRRDRTASRIGVRRRVPWSFADVGDIVRHLVRAKLACSFALLAACSAAPVRHLLPAPIELEGAIHWEGHFRRPHETRSVAARLVVLRDDDRVRAELFETWQPGRDALRTVWVRDPRGCYELEHGASRFVCADGDGERLLRLVLAVLDDDTVVAREPRQHPRLGDIEERAEWRDAEGSRALHVLWHRTHDQAEFVLHRASAGTTAVPPDAFDVGAPAPKRPPRVVPARFSTLAPGVHEVVLHDADTRSLVVEFRDHLVLCESSVDNAAAERVLAAIDQHLPGKPVRHVLFGHYHPHYTGGLRAVMARGAAVAAPPLGAAFAAEISARPFRSPPDALASSGRTPVIETFQGARTFRDDTNELVAIDIGADSHHTDEYIVFHLPRQRLLFQGDLGWFTGPNGLAGGGERARGLLHAIDERALDVATVVQSWPTRGSATLPLAELRALVAKR
jgi:hypothetical protein